MISVEDLLYEIDLKLNKQATLQHQSIPNEDKIVALNNAQINYILSVVTEMSPSKLGVDSSNKKYQDLQILAEDAHDHPLDLALSDGKLNKWDADLSTLTPKYMFYIDSYALADKGECKGIVMYVNNDLTKHNNVITLMNNSNYRPSFEYYEIFNTISNDKIELYTDGTFTFSKVYVSYFRYPKYIDVVGYIKLDGSESVNQDSELPYYLKDMLVDLAIESLAMSTDNQSAVQYTENRLAKKD